MRYRSIVICTAMLAVALVMSGAAFAAVKPLPVDPGNATVDQFQATSACGCHATLIEQWSKSMHAQALTDPIYLAKLEQAQKATDGAIGDFCNKCHGPAAMMTGQFGAAQMAPEVVEGINCSFCHQVSGLLPGDPANTSHLVEANGVRRAQIKDPQAPHAAAYSAFHETSEFCGGCHNVNHPVNGLELEATYSEWAKSPWAKEGVTCQDCHMSKEPGVRGPYKGVAAPGALERSNIYSMTFIGAQVELGDSAAATALLKQAAEVKLEIPEIVGDKAEAVVTVTNTGAGHDLPTGLTEVREMWLDVFLEDASGKRTELGTRMFKTVLEDAEGNAPAELWEAAKIRSDDRIGARESVSEKYQVSLPAEAQSATLKAVLRYRSVPDELAEKAGVTNPVTDMAAAEQVVYSSEEAKSAAAQAEQEAPGGNLLTIVFGVAAAVVVAIAGGLLWYRTSRSAV
jgi:hypothetical protein